MGWPGSRVRICVLTYSLFEKVIILTFRELLLGSAKVARACPSGVHEATRAIRARGERCRARPPRRSVAGGETRRAHRRWRWRRDARRWIRTCVRSWRTCASGRRRSQPPTPPTDLTTPRPTRWARPTRPPSAIGPTPGTRIGSPRDVSRSPGKPRRRTSSHNALRGRGVGCGERTLRKPVLQSPSNPPAYAFFFAARSA